MTRTKQRQTITIEIDLIVYGDGDPEADEIRVNGRAVNLAAEMMKSSWHSGVAEIAGSVVEQIALWAEDPQGWELAE